MSLETDTRPRYFYQCNDEPCGARTQTGLTPGEAVKIARSLGWDLPPGDHRSFCPTHRKD